MADWVCASKFNDHDMELIKIAVLYDNAPQDVKEKASALLKGFVSHSSDIPVPDHSQGQTF